LSSPELSQDPKELSASAEGGPMVFNSSRGNTALQDQAYIKRLAKSGDTQAASFVNPLGDSPNPLDNFNVPTSVKEMERTLAENKGAFAGPKPQKAPESLSSKISSFNSEMGNAEKKLRTLSRANPAAHIQGSLAYQERYSNFLEDNFKGMASDEVGYLMKNPSIADRYLSYKSDGAKPDEAEWLSGIATTDAKAIVELKTNGTIHGKPLDGIGTIESFGHAKDVYDQYKKQLIKPTEDKDLENLGKISSSLKDLRDKDGNLIAGNEALNEKLLGQRDSLMKLPTGTSAYSDKLNRRSTEDEQLAYAQASGVSYKNIDLAAVPKRRQELNEARVSAAIEHAPVLNNKDRMADWLKNPETKGLPFKTTVDGSPSILFPTETVNIYRQWSPAEKAWKTVDLNKKEEPKPTAPATKIDDGMMQEEDTTAIKWVKTLPGEAKKAVANISDYVDSSEVSKIPKLEENLKLLDGKLAKQNLTTQEKNSLIRDRNAYMSQLQYLKKRHQIK
jgi:hypothetical protein